MTLRAVIVDDEPLARAALRSALGAESGVEIVAESGDGPQAVVDIRRHRPDLVLLDVQMPGLDGFGVLSQIPADDLPAVIFVTAYDQFALKAFGVHAVDYLLKPIDDQRLHEAVDQVRARADAERLGDARSRLAALLEELDPAASAGARPTTRPARRVLVRDPHDVYRFQRLDEVFWIGAAGNNVRFHTEKETHEVRMTLRDLVPQLDPAVFRRIHRSTVVNLNAIREIQPWFAGDCLVVLRNGHQLKMSRTYRQQLIRPLA